MNPFRRFVGRTLETPSTYAV